MEQEEDKVALLRGVFPLLDSKVVRKALVDSQGSVADAVDELLIGTTGFFFC